MLKHLLLVYFLLVLGCASSQTISIETLLSLQKMSQIDVQDYLESNSWALDEIVTLKEADSAVFDFAGSKELKINGKSKAIDLTDAAWLKFNSKETVKIENSEYITSVTFNSPSYGLLRAISLHGLKAINDKFEKVIDYAYFGEDMHTKILKEIDGLKTRIVSSSIKTFNGSTIRVYKLKDQVIELVTFNINETNPKTRLHSISISSTQDFNYFRE